MEMKNLSKEGKNRDFISVTINILNSVNEFNDRMEGTEERI